MLPPLIELACYIVCFGLHVAIYPFQTDLEILCYNFDLPRRHGGVDSFQAISFVIKKTL